MRTRQEQEPSGTDRPPTAERDATRIQPLHIAVAPGELIDKITILEIKRERIANPGKRRNVLIELEALDAARRGLSGLQRIESLTRELKAVNETLWEIEDGIRECERNKDFGARFTALARSVYKNNDRRAALKREINERLGSALIEEKSYTAYD